jgi:hypothetical protein
MSDPHRAAIDRRTFLGGLGLSALAMPLAAEAQSPVKVPRIGILSAGSATTDAVAASIDAETYRTFTQSSRAELEFAKLMYVQTRSGWFSDRTECYLASGRPGVARDTGFSDYIPGGEVSSPSAVKMTCWRQWPQSRAATSTIAARRE